MIKRIGAFVFILTLFFALGVTAQAADVPSGYSILEYIESSGTQYIDTGIIGKSGVRSSGRFSQITSSGVFMGSGSSVGFIPLFIDNLVPKYGYSSWYSSSLSLSLNRIYSFDVNLPEGSQYLKIDGSTVISSSNSSSVNTGYPLFVFAHNVRGTADVFSSSRLYTLQLYEGNTLVRDYVPVKNLSGTVGLWDKVTGQFVGNSGTGSFTAGSVVEVVPYPEYQVTVNGSYASNSGSGSYREGVTVTINAGTRDGYIFTGWTSSVPLADSSAATTSFTMPASAVTVTANWQQDAPPVPTYQVTVNGSYASNSGSGSYAEGVTVFIDAGSRDGYSFSGWSGSVNFADSTSVSTSFIMPAEAVSVTANWEELPPPPSPSDFDGWTSVERHVLFSGGDSWLLNLYSSYPSSGGQSYTFYGNSGSFGGTFGKVNNTTYDMGVIKFSAVLGGVLLEEGETYRLRYSLSSFSDNLTPPTLNLGDVTVIASDIVSLCSSSSSSGDIVFTSNSAHYVSFNYEASSAITYYGNISGSLDRVQPTASGDSFSSTASDIENNSNQLTQIENDILTDLEIYSAQVNPLDINFGSGIVNAMSFISSTWTNAFGQLGELQSVVTFPLFLGLALLFIGRASSVIVSGSMKSQRNNDKKGGGDIG